MIVVDPRITPIARTADLFLPVKPGRDVALFNGILHLMIENDWLDHDFIENHTVGFDAVAEHVKQWTPKRTAEVTGIAEKSIRAGGGALGHGEDELPHARARHRASLARRRELPQHDQHRAGLRPHRTPYCGYGTVVGQGNGQGGREHGQKPISFPAGATSRTPSTASTSPASGA